MAYQRRRRRRELAASRNATMDAQYNQLSRIMVFQQIYQKQQRKTMMFIHELYLFWTLVSRLFNHHHMLASILYWNNWILQLQYLSNSLIRWKLVNCPSSSSQYHPSHHVLLLQKHGAKDQQLISKLEPQLVNYFRRWCKAHPGGTANWQIDVSNASHNSCSINERNIGPPQGWQK